MTFQHLLIYAIAPLAGYLLGSIPFAWVIGKSKGIDIRTVGSKNIGATNLGRTLGKRFFWQAFLLDAAKGFLPVLTASILVRHDWSAWGYNLHDVSGWYPAPPPETLPPP